MERVEENDAQKRRGEKSKWAQYLVMVYVRNGGKEGEGGFPLTLFCLMSLGQTCNFNDKQIFLKLSPGCWGRGGGKCAIVQKCGMQQYALGFAWLAGESNRYQSCLEGGRRRNINMLGLNSDTKRERGGSKMVLGRSESHDFVLPHPCSLAS